MVRFFRTGILFIFIALPANAQSLTGTIKGTITQAQTQQPVAGAYLTLLKSDLITFSGENGEFILPDVPVGTYTLQISHVAYQTQMRTDVVVRPNRLTFVPVELQEAVFEMAEVEVTAGYFEHDVGNPVSVTRFNAEEIRRAPGTAGDVSRFLSASPGAAQVDDRINDLIVRGGSPVENAYYVDNMLVPNINHFGMQGSSGGSLSMIDSDVIENVRFYTGGWGAEYGDRLSSIIEIQLREGNPDEFDGKLDADLTGFALMLECPLPHHRGAGFTSVRRSNLDLLVDWAGVDDQGLAPRYTDAQSKITFNLSPQHQINLLHLGGRYDATWDDGTGTTGDLGADQHTFGVNWRYLWRGGYSQTALSHTVNRGFARWFTEFNRTEHVRNNYTERLYHLRNINFYRLAWNHQFKFGLEVSHERADYDYYLESYRSASGAIIPELAVDSALYTTKTAFFFSYMWYVTPRLTLTTGLRLDRFSYNHRTQLAPRFSLTYHLSDRWQINLGSGLIYQAPPLVLYSQAAGNQDNKNLQVFHYIVGTNFRFTPDTQLTVELYVKDYSNFPLDPDDPRRFIADDVIYRDEYRNYGDVRDDGRAYSAGIEVMLQKKLVQGFYGLIGTSLSRTRYRDMQGDWHPRLFDNRYRLHVMGGYKPNARWEFSLRWSWAGGRPYTPFDLLTSRLINEGILDRSQINALRLPDYHSLNLRVDRRFYFLKSNIIFYMSIWNVYNRRNIDRYYWSITQKAPKTIPQFRRIPILGLSYEF